MELDDFICDKCGRSHEACICLDVENDYYYYLDYLQSQHDRQIEEVNSYPKFDGDNVEVSEGVMVSRDVYEKYYK